MIFAFKIEHKTVNEFIYPENYNIDFPEHVFPLNYQLAKNYWDKIKTGLTEMRSSKLTICLLAYNLSQSQVSRLFNRLNVIVKFWKEHQIIIYAADSTNGSFQLIQNLANTWPLKGKWKLLPDNVNKEGKGRMERMSLLRQACNDAIDPDTDYVLWMDADLAGPISLNGITNSMGYIAENKYDAVFANGLITPLVGCFHFPKIGWTYYDPLATVFPGDRWNPDTQNYDKGWITHTLGLVYEKGQPPVRVISGFAGAGIYRAELLRRFRYNICDETKNTCEHVILNRQIHEAGYKLAINPSLLLLAGIQGGTKPGDRDHW